MIVTDVLRVMGWDNLFDVGKKIRLDEKKDALLQIPYFKEYDKYIKIFNPRAEIPKNWDNKGYLQCARDFSPHAWSRSSFKKTEETGQESY